jgi:hypothetical protein
MSDPNDLIQRLTHAVSDLLSDEPSWHRAEEYTDLTDEATNYLRKETDDESTCSLRIQRHSP